MDQMTRTWFEIRARAVSSQFLTTLYSTKFDSFQTIICIIFHDLMRIYIGIIMATAYVDQTLGNGVKGEFNSVDEICVQIHVHPVYVYLCRAVPFQHCSTHGPVVKEAQVWQRHTPPDWLPPYWSIPVNPKHLYNICTMLDQRRRRWADVVQMLYKCFVFAGIACLQTWDVETALP